MTDPQENSLNSLNSLSPESEDNELEKWAMKQIENWPNNSDLQLGLNPETCEFEYCIAYFSYWKWKIDIRPNSFPENGRYAYYPPQITIHVNDSEEYE